MGTVAQVLVHKNGIVIVGVVGMAAIWLLHDVMDHDYRVCISAKKGEVIIEPAGEPESR